MDRQSSTEDRTRHRPVDRHDAYRAASSYAEAGMYNPEGKEKARNPVSRCSRLAESGYQRCGVHSASHISVLL